MSKTYLPYEPDQQLVLPAALQEWLPDDHLAYFISDVVDQLDMSEVTARYERERRGGPPYHPRMMVKALLYGYCVGVASSRRIAQRLHEDIAFRVLATNNTPDFRTISDFRKDNVDALSGLFMQALALCQQAGVVKLGHVALDGTKVKANASKHKAMSYQRMKEKAAQLLRQAQAADDEEDRRYGKDKRGDELPEELAFREGRLEKIREAMAALEAEAQAAAEQAEAEGRKRPGVPDDKAQRNFTDTESRIMPAPGGKDFLQAYNCQAVVDSAHQVVVAARATNQTSDKQQAAAMMEEDHRQRRRSPQGSIRRCWLLLGEGSRRALCSGRGPVRRAGADPPRPGCATGAPRSHTQPSVSQGPDATEVTDQAGSAALRFADANCGAGIRPDQAGPGIPAVSAAGTGEGERRMVADLHGSMGQPNASGTFAEVVSTALFAKLSGGWPGQPAQLVGAIHCR